MNELTIGKLAERSGVNLQTIRYYERLGLVPKPPRSRSGYRLFPEDAPRRVRFIKRAQELGFSLKEIKELLALRIEPGKTRADVRERAEAKISDMDEKIKSLREMRKSLAEITKVCRGPGPINHCPILESLNHEESPTLSKKRREVNAMALQKGERYRCPDRDCGCEIEVTKGAAPGKGGNLNPRCCCGKEMQKVG